MLSKLYKKIGNFGLCVVLPFLLAAFYFLVFASDRYVSSARVIVKQSDSIHQMPAEIPLLSSNFGPNNQDALLVQDYIVSLDMLRHLDETLQIRQHYSQDTIDWLTRLSDSASQEDFLEYYQDHIDIQVDDTSSIITVKVQGFSAEYAQKLLQEILSQSEKFINRIGHRLAQEQVEFVEGEVKRAQEHLRRAKQNVLEFQNKHVLFSPESEGKATQMVVNELEAQLARAETEMKSLLSFMHESAPQVVTLKSQIDAIKEQLQQERSKLAGVQNKQTLNELNAQFQDLKLDIEFATDLYKTSLLTLEQARLEAYRKLKYLVVIDSPSLPESAEYPETWYNLVTILVGLLVLYGIVVILVATIKEHKDA